MRTAIRGLLGFAFASSLCACATSGTKPEVAHPSVHFTAPGPGAERYTSEPAEGDALRGPHASRAGRGIARAAQEHAHPLAPDARLGQLAEQVGGALDAHGSPPPFAVIDLWSHHLGLFEPAPHLLVLSQSDAATLEDRVASELGPLLPQQRYTHYGAATFEQNGTVVVVLALSWRWLELAPVSRTIELGASIELKGRLLDDLLDAELVVSYPDGTSDRGPAQKGTAIALHVASRGRGEHRIELLASSTLGDTVVANFPIYVGISPTTEVTVGAAPSAGSELNEGQSKQRLFALVNEDRKRAGVSPLALDDRLSRVARSHSNDMQEHGFVGHTSPTTGNADDRVRGARIRTPLVLENIGRGYSADEVHRGLMESPGHRQNVLNKDATHVGIGIVLSSEDQRTAYLVTEVFARFASKIDLGKAPEDLLRAINRERARRGLKALASDAKMSTLCGETARALFHSPEGPRQQVVEQLNRKAASARPPYSRLSALLTFVTTLDEAAVLEALLDPHARALGLGVAQGTRSDTIDDAIAVVALIGY